MQYPYELQETIQANGLAVIPTDTIYGIVGSALHESVVEKIYQAKKRDATKPLIVLISDMNQLGLFGISPQVFAPLVEPYWPGPVSIILPCENDTVRYLHRGSNTIAFRLPALESLRDVIRIVGPLVAPSANPEQLPPATTIDEAKQYFGDLVQCYVDGGEIHGSPSTLLAIGLDGSVTKLR